MDMIWYNIRIGFRYLARQKTISLLNLLGLTIGMTVAILIFYFVNFEKSYYIMHKWLQNFAYKTDLTWWIFGLAGIIALTIALLTVSLRTWRAATMNPVKALRYE